MDNFALGSIGAGAIWVIVGIVFFIAFISYPYYSLCLCKICKKCGVENTWLSWIPIVQVVPFLRAGEKPLWWIFILVLVIPVILVFMAIAKRLGKPSWVGILIIVPIMNVFVPAYLAFTD